MGDQQTAPEQLVLPNQQPGPLQFQQKRKWTSQTHLEECIGKDNQLFTSEGGVLLSDIKTSQERNLDKKQ